jgi:hypothetical protein
LLTINTADKCRDPGAIARWLPPSEGCSMTHYKLASGCRWRGSFRGRRIEVCSGLHQEEDLALGPRREI